jgi:hypothetical protein
MGMDVLIYMGPGDKIASQNMSLPTLPLSSSSWSVAVRNAYQRLNQIYETTHSYIDSGSLDANRLQYYGNLIIDEAYPLLLLLAESAESESLPEDWIEDVATHFTMLLELVNEHWLSVANAKYV